MTPRFSRDFWSHRVAVRRDAAHAFSDLDVRQEHVEHLAASPGEVDKATSFEAGAGDGASLPVCLFVPEHYEPNYAYPLIVWLHGGGGNERELLTAMPMISRRNYLGLSFRGAASKPARQEPGRGRRAAQPDGYHWSSVEADPAQFEARLFEAVRNLRREYHVHSERVFLAGFDEGAALALHLLLRQPQRYGGAICLGGRFPQTRQALARFRDLRGKQVLISAGSRDAISTPADNVKAGRLLHSAGMSVSTRIVDAGHEVTRTMLRQIDHWIMDGICAAT